MDRLLSSLRARTNRLRLMADRAPLGLKIGIALATLIGGAFALYLLVYDGRHRLMEQKAAEARKIGELVVAIVRKEMRAHQPERVQEHLDVILEHRDVQDIRLFAADGELLFALDRTAVGRHFDRRDTEECQGCHHPGEPPATTRIRDAGGQRVFTVDYALRNEITCQECHLEDDRVLGNLLLDIAFSDADLAALASDRRLASTGALIALATLALAWLLMRAIVVRPVQALVAATARVEAGDFDPAFPRAGGDEIGTLVHAFRRMTARLGRLVHDQEAEIVARTEALRRSQQRAIHQEKMAALGRLSGGLAHEIGNPLASISAMSQMLRRRAKDDQERATIDDILEQIERIHRIVRDLLEHLHPGPRRVAWVDVGAAIRKALRIAHYDRSLTRVSITTRIESDLPRVRLVEDELLQVLLNLVFNALDAMPEGGTLSLRAGRAGEGTVEIQVEDEGTGIHPENLTKVFDPFFTTKPAGKGTGLGLWVCDSIVERWHGRIQLDSAPGRGTCVTLFVPVPKEDTDGGHGSDRGRRARTAPELAIGAD